MRSKTAFNIFISFIVAIMATSSFLGVYTFAQLTSDPPQCDKINTQFTCNETIEYVCGQYEGCIYSDVCKIDESKHISNIIAGITFLSTVFIIVFISYLRHTKNQDEAQDKLEKSLKTDEQRQLLAEFSRYV